MIAIEPIKNIEELSFQYHQEVGKWSQRVANLKKKDSSQHSKDSGFHKEIEDLEKLLDYFMVGRLQQLQGFDEKRKHKYLQVMLPFTTKNSVESFLSHFFQIKCNQQQNLEYSPLDPAEKELRILYDLYKVKKTIETITILQNVVKKKEAFASIFTQEEQLTCLEDFKTIFKLQFQRYILPEHQRTLYKNISAEIISEEEILNRKKNKISYFRPNVIERFDYRIQFFIVFFSSRMRAKYNGEVCNFQVNFLNLEILKQEYLTHWLTKKLKNNPDKSKIYKNYQWDKKTLLEHVEQNPEQENKILQQMPLRDFNNLAAEVNDNVSPEHKTAVTPFSEKFGDIGKITNVFNKAQIFLSKTLKKITPEFVLKTPSHKEIHGSISQELSQSLEPEKKNATQPKEKEKEEKPKEPFEIRLLKKNEIDFPYFLKEAKDYQARVKLLRVKWPDKFPDFSRKLTKFLNNLPESNIVRRRTPVHEWTLPYTIKDNKTQKVYFLLLGAELSTKKLGMSYSSSQNEYTFSCFFSFGVMNGDESFGNSTDERKIHTNTFFMYDFRNKQVQEKAWDFFHEILKKEKQL